jgi:5,10-methylenetetrahydrofolate reductase
VEEARLLKIRGVDAVCIPDDRSGAARMSALAVAVLVEQQAGVETVLQYSCRDRRLAAMQADLLGAHAMGLRNLLLVTGGPLKHGDYADATEVFEVDSIGLTNAVARLNQGIDIGGQPLDRPTAFHIGVRANPASLTLDDEVRRYQYKADAGAEFAITEPIYDAADLESFVRRVEDRGLPLIVTVRPFESLRHAEWLANEVPNVRVPESLIERMRAANAAGRAVDEGIAIARELVTTLRPLVSGLHIVPPAGRTSVALGVMEALNGPVRAA